MFKETALSGQTTFFQKLRSMDYILLVCILILGVISSLAMYATDGGELLYHTKSHVLRFIIFFVMMFVLSFLNIRFWHATGYLFYIIGFGITYMGISLRNYCLWFSKMGRFILYKSSTVRIDENCHYSLFCKILSQSPDKSD